MTTEPEPDPPVTEVAVVEAQRRAREAREQAAHAGLSAAKSIERSARRHEEVAELQEQTAAKGIPAPEVNHASAARHRNAAQDDYTLARKKRAESEADLSADQ
ncbi:hypothetical protein SAMN04489835_1659 [Mycolicibacterium rutilum]|uniref:Uncharacterized protein n=1 Tax=Mycolicibacterium rutilum TaxID=370526 RepID=A0A1H6JC46_MYCRU|nr:hypothetical protein [Mycolicibacterium rutilum]SEH57955.1 hypothetical protein SAMN04489835_1659 [Mycolicibacterium rutilum]